MIKGVNKKIVEINNPKSLYFDKAILYVKPEMSDVPIRFLSQEAQNYLESISPISKSNNNNHYISAMLIAITAIGLITGIAGIIMIVCS
jgi:hypothetical protein